MREINDQSKIISNHPKSWIQVRLGEIIKLEYGKSLTKHSRNEEGEFPVYGSSGVVGQHDDFLVNGPCLVVGRKGGVGEVWLSKSKCWPIDTTYFTRVNNDCLSISFLFFLLKSLRLGQYDKSTAIPGLNRNDAYNILIGLPPLAEQHRIVDKIEELFSDLDDGIASLKKAQQQLKVYRQAVLKWAFEGKLTAQWREEQQRQGKLESAETLLEQIKAERDQRYQGKYQKALMPEFILLPHVPEEWSLVTLDQLSLLITSGSRGWAKYYSNSGDFFIRAQDINTDSLRLDRIAYVNPLKVSEGQRTRVQLGDLLITMTGANVTKSALVSIDFKKPAYVNQHVGLVRLSKLINSKFIYYWIISSQNGRAQLMKSAYGAGKPGLNLTNLKEVIIVLPSLQEQNKIVEEIESRLSICDSLEATITENLQRAEALRQSILKQAFEGKLVPQDPNDEPASVLLERIRQTRNQHKQLNLNNL